MDIDALAKKIREAVMDSAEDQGRTFNASSLDEVIAKELRVHMPAPAPKPPQQYPWHVVPFAGTTDARAVELMKRGAVRLTVNGVDCLVRASPDDVVDSLDITPGPWFVVPFGCDANPQWSEDELRVLMARSAKELAVNKVVWRHSPVGAASGGTMAGEDEWR